MVAAVHVARRRARGGARRAHDAADARAAHARRRRPRGDLARFGEELGGAAASACEDAAAELPADWIDTSGRDALRLSDPEGMLFSNDAIATVFARLDERLDGEEDEAGDR